LSLRNSAQRFRKAGVEKRNWEEITTKKLDLSRNFYDWVKVI
jgi:hypothetical protein